MHVLFIFFFFEKRTIQNTFSCEGKSRDVSSYDYEQCGANYTLDTLHTMCHSPTRQVSVSNFDRAEGSKAPLLNSFA
jgi:hypothetical protein